MLNSITQKINALRQRVEEEKARVEAGGEPSPVVALLTGVMEVLVWTIKGLLSAFLAGLLAVPVLLILPWLKATDAAWLVWYAVTYILWWSVAPRPKHVVLMVYVLAGALFGFMFLLSVARHVIALAGWFLWSS